MSCDTPPQNAGIIHNILFHAVSESGCRSRRTPSIWRRLPWTGHAPAHSEQAEAMRYLCTLPDPPSFSKAFTSATVDRLKSPVTECFRQLAATANSNASWRTGIAVNP